MSIPQELHHILPLCIRLLSIVALSIIASLLSHRLLTRLSERFRRTPSHWDDTLTRAARPIVTIGFMLLGLSLATDVLVRHFEINTKAFNISLALGYIRRFSTIILLYAFLMRYLKMVRDSFEETERAQLKMDRSSVELMIKLLQLGISIATALTLLQNTGVSISGLLAFGGVGGLAVGLAAKDMLANLFGGLTLYMDRPFVVGDKVNLKEKGVEGFVEHIGWRQTRIRGYDRTPIYVPNALFTNIAVINPSRMQNRRVDMYLGIRYKDFDRLEAVTTAIRNYLSGHEQLDHIRGCLAHFTDYGDSSLNIRIRFYTLTTLWDNYMNLRHEILIHIGQIIHEHGADFAFPTRTLDLPEGFNAPADGAATPD
ncbi:mechanosensitive ion channel family protein [Parendozoicomonas haliclonae]|uniref:Low conductance mechanosensitive channel YnaI n=1 Tax=Parendozoicomonas haliclonae TaxID=1960125 RepID=A0A1X7APE9_9GAMM|nr:mechanosensitive ion channel family protein [Parendozoicomonas haliclonae]SMA49970.1 Low conductance mechanosensitive channel YnaI [Parendozoicomonas haliclonae]